MGTTAESATVSAQPFVNVNWAANGTTHTCTWRWTPAVSYPTQTPQLLHVPPPPVRLTDDEIDRIAKRVAELLKPRRKKEE